MPPSPDSLTFKTGIWQNEVIHFRAGHVIIEVDTRGLSDPEIENALHQALDAVSHQYHILRRIGGWAYARLDDIDDIDGTVSVHISHLPSLTTEDTRPGHGDHEIAVAGRIGLDGQKGDIEFRFDWRKDDLDIIGSSAGNSQLRY